MKLHLGDTIDGKRFNLPDDAVTQTFAAIGRKGSGKTYAAGKLAELLMDSGAQVIVLDTVGNWWGLRKGADGKSDAFEVPILGGLRGDIPLEATGGELIARIAVDSGRSLILDISQFSLADRQRFAHKFGEQLWQRKKAERHPSPVHIVIEESQLIVPERVKPDQAAMVGIWEEIIRLGRNYGIGVTMISQRPQSVNKEVLNQTECLLVFQVNGAHERKALKDWIVHAGMDVKLVDELPGLPQGTTYLWSPQWLRVLAKIKVAAKRTFDATATPKMGKGNRARRELKPLNLDDLKDKMAETVERAKQDDPRELRRQIADLKKQLSKPATTSTAAGKVKRVEVPILGPKTESVIKRAGELYEKMRADIEKYTAIRLKEAATIQRALDSIFTAARTQVENQRRHAYEAMVDEPHKHAPERPPAAVPQPRPRLQAQSQQSTGEMSKAERAILIAAGQTHPVPASRIQLSVLSGYSMTSSSFANALGALRSRGFLAGLSDQNVITEEGLLAAGEFDPRPAGPELISWWARRLNKAEGTMLEAIAGLHPQELTKEQLSEASGYSISSSSFANALGKLRSLGLIDRPAIRLSTAFFQ